MRVQWCPRSVRVRWILGLVVIAALWLLWRPHASRGLGVYLAESTKGRLCDEMNRQVFLRVGADRSVSINGESVTVEGLERRLEKVFESRSDRLVFIWPEENAEFGRVAEVIDAAQSKTARFALVTDKVERDPGDCGPALMTPRRRVVPNPYVQPVGWR